MLRVILDTNIFELILVDADRIKIHGGLHIKEVYIYGFSIIRKELRAVPKKKIAGINLRAALLRVYDELVKKTYAEDNNITNLAEKYFRAYKELNPNASYKKMINDFLIIACASLKNLDIVVSEDNSTMLNDNAIKVYKLINAAEKIKHPDFIGFNEFKNILSRK